MSAIILTFMFYIESSSISLFYYMLIFVFCFRFFTILLFYYFLALAIFIAFFLIYFILISYYKNFSSSIIVFCI